jgi:hypothetical protein
MLFLLNSGNNFNFAVQLTISPTNLSLLKQILSYQNSSDVEIWLKYEFFLKSLQKTKLFFDIFHSFTHTNNFQFIFMNE